MIINRPIKPYLYELDRIYTFNRKRYPDTQSYMLYQITIDFMHYWRQLANRSFDSLSIAAQDELYFYFNERLRHFHDVHLDLYWLIDDLDGEPLYSDGRSPDRFWLRKLEHQKLQLERMNHYRS